MAKIKLSELGGFTLIPEGTTIFKIVEVEYKEDFGKMEVVMQTKSGSKHTEKFTFVKNSGEVNDGAIKAFSYLAKTALNNFSLDEIDDQDIVGCYIVATVKHEEFESNKEPGKMLKSVRLSDYAHATSFNSPKNDDEYDRMADEELENESDDDLDDFLD